MHLSACVDLFLFECRCSNWDIVGGPATDLFTTAGCLNSPGWFSTNYSLLGGQFTHSGALLCVDTGANAYNYSFTLSNRACTSPLSCAYSIRVDAYYEYLQCTPAMFCEHTCTNNSCCVAGLCSPQYNDFCFGAGIAPMACSLTWCTFSSANPAPENDYDLCFVYLGTGCGARREKCPLLTQMRPDWFATGQINEDCVLYQPVAIAIGLWPVFICVAVYAFSAYKHYRRKQRKPRKWRIVINLCLSDAAIDGVLTFGLLDHILFECITQLATLAISVRVLIISNHSVATQTSLTLVVICQCLMFTTGETSWKAMQKARSVRAPKFIRDLVWFNACTGLLTVSSYWLQTLSTLDSVTILWHVVSFTKSPQTAALTVSLLVIFFGIITPGTLLLSLCMCWCYRGKRTDPGASQMAALCDLIGVPYNVLFTDKLVYIDPTRRFALLRQPLEEPAQALPAAMIEALPANASVIVVSPPSATADADVKSEAALTTAASNTTTDYRQLLLGSATTEQTSRAVSAPTAPGIAVAAAAPTQLSEPAPVQLAATTGPLAAASQPTTSTTSTTTAPVAVTNFRVLLLQPR